MALADLRIIDILRRTAKAITHSPHYQWGHMGACNCGFLAQQITQLSKGDIHAIAMRGDGDWSEQLKDFCPTSGLDMDVLITTLTETGFTIDDLTHLERLSDQTILRTLPADSRHLRFNVKSDVVLYLLTWAELLERDLLASIRLPELKPHPEDNGKVRNLLASSPG